MNIYIYIYKPNEKRLIKMRTHYLLGMIYNNYIRRCCVGLAN
jgi:hypothetical protein